MSDAKEKAVELPVEIPIERLDPETLRRVISEYVGREGTDYGMHEFSLEQKIDQVFQQLKRRKAILVFDASTESITIIPR